MSSSVSVKNVSIKSVSVKSVSVKDLVAKIKAGDPRAEDQFYRHFRPLVQTILRQKTDDASLIEDLIQDSLLTVLLRIRDQGIQQPEKIASYVAQTARYTLIGWFRRKGNQHGSAMDVANLKSPETALEDELMAVEREAIVKSLISLMRVPRDQELLQRNYFFDEDKSSLCRQFDLPDQHFDRVISRARGRFKKIIQAQRVDTRIALQPS